MGRWATKRFNSVAMGSIRVVDARYDKVLAELAEAKVLIARLEESRLYATKEREAAREERKNLQDQIEDLREDRH